MVDLKGFSDWLYKIFQDWQREQRGKGESTTVAYFADSILGISQPLASQWLNGKKAPSKVFVDKLANLYGDEIYKFFDYERPNRDLQIIEKRWENLPEVVKKQVMDLINRER